jgi:hypothetical protein
MLFQACCIHCGCCCIRAASAAFVLLLLQVLALPNNRQCHLCLVPRFLLVASSQAAAAFLLILPQVLTPSNTVQGPLCQLLSEVAAALVLVLLQSFELPGIRWSHVVSVAVATVAAAGLAPLLLQVLALPNNRQCHLYLLPRFLSVASSQAAAAFLRLLPQVLAPSNTEQGPLCQLLSEVAAALVLVLLQSFELPKTRPRHLVSVAVATVAAEQNQVRSLATQRAHPLHP